MDGRRRRRLPGRNGAGAVDGWLVDQHRGDRKLYATTALPWPGPAAGARGGVVAFDVEFAPAETD